MKPKIGAYYRHLKTKGIFVLRVIAKDQRGYKVLIVEDNLDPSHEGKESYWGPSAYKLYAELTDLEVTLL